MLLPWFGPSLLMLVVAYLLLAESPRSPLVKGHPSRVVVVVVLVVVVKDCDRPPSLNNKRGQNQDQSPPSEGDLAKRTWLFMDATSRSSTPLLKLTIIFPSRILRTSYEALVAISEEDFAYP